MKIGDLEAGGSAKFSRERNLYPPISFAPINRPMTVFTQSKVKVKVKVNVNLYTVALRREHT